MKNKKFDKVFDTVDEKIGSKKHIDFENSSVNGNQKPTKEKEKRIERIQAYLTKKELVEFYKTMKAFDEQTQRPEKSSERLRNLILKDIEKRKK